jgi:hypothetical protein
MEPEGQEARVRANQLRRVLQLLNPRQDLLEDCRLDVEVTLGSWGYDGGTYAELYELPPKQRKIAAQKFRAALKRVIATSKAFHEGTWMYDYMDVGRPELLSLAEKFIKKCDHIIKTSHGPPKRSAKKKRWAAESAMRLIHEYHKDSDNFADLDMSLCSKVARILYGDPAADFRPYVRERKKLVVAAAARWQAQQANPAAGKRKKPGPK